MKYYVYQLFLVVNYANKIRGKRPVEWRSAQWPKITAEPSTLRLRCREVVPIIALVVSLRYNKAIIYKILCNKYPFGEAK